MRTLNDSAALFVVFTLIGSAAVAQSSPTASVATPPAAQAGPPPNASSPASSPGPSNDGSSHTAPVLWLTSVEVLRSTHSPQLDVVRVRGLASTDGWESAELIPLTKGVPYDGILDLAFVAEAPADQSAPTGFPEVEAILALEPGHPFRGVRVHGATNRLTLRALPGFVEAGSPPRDCVACVGKYFVPKSGAVPPGKNADQVVREESLPVTLRVVRKNEGVGQLSSDPNRMTIVLDDEDRIALAFWD